LRARDDSVGFPQRWRRDAPFNLRSANVGAAPPPSRSLLVRAHWDWRPFLDAPNGRRGSRPKFKTEGIESNFKVLGGSDRSNGVAATAAISADANPKFRSPMATARDNPFRQR
jgi:hypothetical protein